MSYTLRELTANPGNYGGARTAGEIRYLVFHYTGNAGDTAADNAAYFQRTVVQASAHYFVDDGEVYRSVPDLRAAWAVGGGKYPSAGQTGGGTMYGIITNTNSLSIELCGTAGNGSREASEATLANAAALGRELMARYGISLDHVYRHFDVTGKLCPVYLTDAQAWAAFKQRLALDNTPSPAHREGVEWAVANGLLRGNTDGDLMLSRPVTREQLCTMLYRLAGRVGVI